MIRRGVLRFPEAARVHAFIRKDGNDLVAALQRQVHFGVHSTFAHFGDGSGEHVPRTEFHHPTFVVDLSVNRVS